jgi:hypothetical protein
VRVDEVLVAHERGVPATSAMDSISKSIIQALAELRTLREPTLESDQKNWRTEMVGMWGLEPQTSTVSKMRSFI